MCQNTCTGCVQCCAIPVACVPATQYGQYPGNYTYGAVPVVPTVPVQPTQYPSGYAGQSFVAPTRYRRPRMGLGGMGLGGIPSGGIPSGGGMPSGGIMGAAPIRGRYRRPSVGGIPAAALGAGAFPTLAMVPVALLSLAAIGWLLRRLLFRRRMARRAPKVGILRRITRRLFGLPAVPGMGPLRTTSVSSGMAPSFTGGALPSRRLKIPFSRLATRRGGPLFGGAVGGVPTVSGVTGRERFVAAERLPGERIREVDVVTRKKVPYHEVRDVYEGPTVTETYASPVREYYSSEGSGVLSEGSVVPIRLRDRIKSRFFPRPIISQY